MLNDIVIDTNVFVHASDASSPKFVASKALAKRMLEVETLLIVDEGFSANESKNKSPIVYEYFEKLRFGMYGFYVLVELFSGERVSSPEIEITHQTKRAIVQIIRNKTDQKFLAVSVASKNKVLVSHDYTDFQVGKRIFIKRAFSTDVLTAEECVPRLIN